MQNKQKIESLRQSINHFEWCIQNPYPGTPQNEVIEDVAKGRIIIEKHKRDLAIELSR